MAEKINVTFLGTGSSIPTKNRNHPCVHLKYKDQNFLFDCGEGTQRQIRKAKLSPNKISKIFITHWHGDHTLGLPGLLQTMSLNDYNGDLEIHGPIGTKQKMKLLIDFHMKSYLKESRERKNNFNIKVYEHKKGEIIDNEDVRVSCFKLEHGINAIGYAFEVKEKRRINKKKLEKLKLPNSPKIKDLTLGKDITINAKKIKAKDVTYIEEAKKISYVSDTIYFDTLIKQVKNSNLLIIESTYLESEKELSKKYMHLTSKDSATIAKKSNTDTLALIHLSQRHEANNKNVKSESQKYFKGKIIVPKDFDSISI